ncbi:NAD-dependent epimerase/dehydratase family protein [Myroides sp. LJL119]
MILVTGATGLVGSHLILALTMENQTIRAIYREKQNLEKTKKLFIAKNQAILFNRIQWVQADLLDIPSLEQAFQDITHVYHCAAYISFDSKEKRKIRKVNIQGTANIVNLAIDYKIEKLCYVSSIAALGENIDTNIAIDEQTQWNPEIYHSHYSMSKYGGEMEVWRATQEGLKVIIINPGIIFSDAYLNSTTNQIFSQLEKGMTYYTNGIAAIVFIDDVIKSMIYLMQSDISNKRFVIVSNNVSYKELMQYLARQLDCKTVPIKIAGTLLCKLAYNLDAIVSKLSGNPRSFTRDMAIASNSKNFYSSQQINKLLPTTLQDYKNYLPKVIDFYKKNKNKPS